MGVVGTLQKRGTLDLSSWLAVTFNARALTALPLADGGTLASRVLFRSDGLGALTPDGVASLASLGIGTVVDLRTEGERAAAPDVLPADGSVELLELPVLGGDMAGMARQLLGSQDGAAPTEMQLAQLADSIPTIESLYLDILREGSQRFARLARAVIDRDGTERPGVLFHCTAGKDRTGVAAAVLLSVAGVTREGIIADYTLTGVNLQRGFAQQLLGMVAQTGIPVTPRLRELATESPAEAIESALDWVRDEHGDAARYLQQGGLSADEIDKLRRILRG